MTTIVSANTAVVNAAPSNGVDRGSHTRHYVRVSTLKERLRWVLQNKREEAPSERGWALKAGLAAPAVTKLLEREGTDEQRIEMRSITLLAEAAGVPPEWLAYGAGGPEDPAALAFLNRIRRLPGLEETVEKHPERWRASTLVRATVTPFKCDSAGIPEGGWERALDTLELRIRPTTTASDVTKATATQVGKRPKLPKK